MKQYNQYVEELKQSGSSPDYQALYCQIDSKINKRSFLTLPRLALASLLLVLLLSFGVYWSTDRWAQTNEDALISYVFEQESNGTFWSDSLSN